MKHRGLILAALAIGIVLLFGGALILQERPKETKDRLPDGVLAQMVEGPMAAVRGGGLVEGDAAFQRLVARARSDRVRVADLYMAYGVGLYGESTERNDPVLLQASRDRLWASIPHYRAAFGPKHPEVALALNSFADVDIQLNGDVSSLAEVSLWEALEIRRAALGPTHPETLAVEDQLKGISGRGLRPRGSSTWKLRDKDAPSAKP